MKTGHTYYNLLEVYTYCRLQGVSQSEAETMYYLPKEISNGFSYVLEGDFNTWLVSYTDINPIQLQKEVGRLLS